MGVGKATVGSVVEDHDAVGHHQRRTLGRDHMPLGLCEFVPCRARGPPGPLEVGACGEAIDVHGVVGLVDTSDPPMMLPDRPRPAARRAT